MDYNTELEELRDKVKKRHEVQKEIAADLISTEFVKDSKWEIAATDLYVEKIESLLTVRSGRLIFWGVALAILVVFIFVLTTIAIYFISPKDFIGGNDMSTQYLIIYFIKATSLVGLVFGCIYYLSSLSKALFHEATVALNRRHALRYGRLFVHINRDNLTKTDLEKAFKSTDQFHSAFKDIDVNTLNGNHFIQLIELVKDLIKQINSNNIESRKGKS